MRNVGKKKRIFMVATAVVAVATIAIAIYIMYRRLGLRDELDFGAGAYYYADIPEFEKYTERSSFFTKIPYFVYVLLFLLWGWLMWKLWRVIEGKNKDNDNKTN